MKQIAVDLDVQANRVVEKIGASYESRIVSQIDLTSGRSSHAGSLEHLEKPALIATLDRAVLVGPLKDQLTQHRASRPTTAGQVADHGRDELHRCELASKRVVQRPLDASRMHRHR